jgi:peptide/nickel transport system permease protein
LSAPFLLALIARRLIALIGLLIVISFGVFALLYLTPGDPARILLGTRPATPEMIHAVRSQYHLDQPFLTQYWTWLTHAATFDFGQSTRTQESVASAIASATHVTLFLGLYGFVIATVLGIPLGVVSALKKRTIIDRGIVAFGVIGVSAPPFATGVLLLYVFAVLLGWFPAFGDGVGFADRLWHLALPAFALGLTGMALILKFTRAAMIEVLDQDYVAFARARGVPRVRVLFVYGLRNALVPIVTSAGLILGYMLTGAVLVEVTFALPGVGSLLINAVAAKDVPMVQGIALILAVMITLVNLVTDILYLAIDPRIRFTQARV